MIKRFSAVIFLVSFLVVACSSAEISNIVPTTITAEVKPTSTIEPPILRPSMASWTLGQDQFFDESNWSLAVHLVQMTSEDIIVIYSALGSDLENQINEAKISLTDNQDGKYNLRSNVNLATAGEIQIGALLFTPSQTHADELYLSIKQSKKDIPTRIILVKGLGSPEELHTGGTSFTLFRQGYLEQSPYRISNNGSGLYKGDRVGAELSDPGMTFDQVIKSAASEATRMAETSKSTPTPVAEGQITLELLDGSDLDFDMTIRIEDTSLKQVYFVYIVFPEAGNIRATLLE